MSNFFWYLLFALSPLYAQNIVFIHLGPKAPSCIFTTLKQARYLNPECSIYLLTDKDGYPAFHTSSLMSEQRISLIDMTSIPQTEEHITFNKINKIDPLLFEGFWRYALERFFYLFDFIKDRDLQNTVHLESDSMLYVDIQELLPYFQRINASLAAPFQSMVGCIPCFVFIKDFSSLTPLMNHIISEMREYAGPRPHIDVNDMQTLASFYLKFGESYMTKLPVLMPEYSLYYSKRESNFEPDNNTSLDFLSTNADLFPGFIFDAATLGVFANGNDRRYFPKNGPGIIHYRSLFDPGHFTFFWGKDQKVPFLSFQGKNYRIVNMHFHSKLPEEFTSYAERRAEFSKRSHP